MELRGHAQPPFVCGVMYNEIFLADDSLGYLELEAGWIPPLIRGTVALGTEIAGSSPASSISISFIVKFGCRLRPSLSLQRRWAQSIFLEISWLPPTALLVFLPTPARTQLITPDLLPFSGGLAEIFYSLQVFRRKASIGPLPGIVGEVDYKGNEFTNQVFCDR